MIGKVIGNYQINGELAQGGMGAVYRGRHQSLPREVVVKSILLSSFPPQAQDQLKARFVREAYIQSQLDHPNIVRVYEFFTSPENYYLVMEFVNGMSLRDLLKRQGALAPNQAIPLFRQALAALDYAHSFTYEDESGRQHKGIIHRDIKPANLLLDGRANLKITDFGIVKFAGERSMTRTGFNPGTVEYMSPEQIRGLEVDARSDLYSLGVSLYEALTGRLPFPYSETGSEYEVLKGHMEVPPPPIATIRPDISPALAAVVMRSLEKDPDRRFQSATEFLDALLQYERMGVTASNQTELIASVPQPQPIPPATEWIVPDTNIAPHTSESGPPAPTHPNNGKPVANPAASVPQRISSRAVPTQSRRTGFVVGGVLVLLLAAAGGAYFLWSSKSAPSTNDAAAANATNTPTNAVSPTSPPVEDERLKQARALEQEERYVEAIKLYEEITRGATQSDSANLSARVAELKRLQGLLAVADLEMTQKDFATARRDYFEALKLRPESKRAQTGLAESEARLAK